MAFQLKPLNQQTIVITGASSGIGLTTARLAAERGANLVLVARSDQELQKLVADIQDRGGRATAVVADVGEPTDIGKVLGAALESFGGFDTWVNNAGVSVYGKFHEVSVEDARRVFETNFWGMVYGSRAAAAVLRERGGALINVGSIVSERAVPLQSYYNASKHAVSGFTDSIRMELEKDGAPVSVTLIMPSAIDTPFIDHAKAYTEREPNFPPPVYAPEVVAEAILYCAQHPKRHVTVGGGGKIITMLGNHAPWLMDKVMEWTMFGQQQKSTPNDPLRHDALYRPQQSGGAEGGGQERGSYEGMVRERSYYTQAELHPVAAALTIAGAGLAAVAAFGAIGAFAARSRKPEHFRSHEAPTPDMDRGVAEGGRGPQPNYAIYEESAFPETGGKGYVEGRGI